ncbi:hypothetical protein Leryth_006301 [Lithospermum erythrorhizon]|nr:hypothetical protein Leryth_006301 [Lithospermum erythrorhizon]
MLTILLAFLYINNNVITKVRGSLFPHTTHVYVLNKLGGNTELKIHCRSKDDDLGTFKIGNGAQYEFKFRPNFFRGLSLTQFYCDLSYGNKIKRFDLYEQFRDKGRCRRCYWDVKPEGVHGYDDLVRRYIDANPIW